MRRHLYCFDACYESFSSFVFHCDSLYPDNHSLRSTDLFLSSDVLVVYFYIHFLPFSVHLLIYSPFLFTVTTLSTPVSEITTLSLQSNTNVPSTSHSTTSSSLSGDIEATTASNEQRTEESLKVLPLTANKTISTNNDKDDTVTVTLSTPSAMTVNLFDAKNKPETIRNGETLKQFVNNDSDNQPQSELVAGEEMDEKSRSNHEKEGRAINFPLEIGSSNQSSTASDHMSGSVNFVTTSTEKPHVMSFFDLSDVSMDHDDEHREMEMKGIEKTNEKQTAGHEIISGCLHNGTSHKVC